MSEKRAELLLATVIVTRSTSFVFNKLGLGTISAFNLLAVRFLLAFLLLMLLFHKKLRHVQRRTVARGALLGGLFFLVMACEMFALRTVNSGTVSLLENMAILFVPLLESLLTRTASKPVTLISAAVALVGVALLTSGGGAFHIGVGECIALGAAVTYACAIITTDRCTHHGEDGFVLGILQVGFLGDLRAYRRAAVRVAPAASDRRGVGHRSGAGADLHRVRLYAAAGGAELYLGPAGQPVLRAEPGVCHGIRRGAAAGAHHALGRGGHPADPGEHRAAAFFEGKAK